MTELMEDLHEGGEGQEDKQFLQEIKQEIKQNSRGHHHKEDITTIKKLLMEDTVVSYISIDNKEGENKFKKSLSSIPQGCYWKIEGKKFTEGGKVGWDTHYRLRHCLTGKYLIITKDLEDDVG